MKNNKSDKIYMAWQKYDEINYLDLQSDSGWNLKSVCLFRKKFEYDPQNVYKYCIGYSSKLHKKDEFIKEYEDKGWQFIFSTFTGWYYFRKLKSDFNNEEQFTYKSINHKFKKWLKIYIIICICCVLFFLGNIIPDLIDFKLRVLPVIMTLGVTFSILYKGIISYKLKNNNKSTKPLDVKKYIIIYFLLLTLLFFNCIFQDNLSTEWTQKNDNKEVTSLIEYKVIVPDFYYFSLNCISDSDIIFTIVNDKDEMIYSYSGNTFQENKRIFLMPGNYEINIKYDNSYNENDSYVKININ